MRHTEAARETSSFFVCIHIPNCSPSTIPNRPSNATMGGAGLLTRMSPYKTPTPRPTTNEKNNTFIPIPPPSPELECKAVATQPPKAEVAQHLQVRFCCSRCGGLNIRTGSGVGRANDLGLPLRISAILFDRRPAWTYR